MKFIRTLFLILVAATLAMAAGTGSITGKVSGIPAAKAAPGAFPPPPIPAVVYAVPEPDKTAPAPTGAFMVDQKYTEFTPSISAVPEGATVTFKNEDTVNHNVELFAANGTLLKDLGTHPPDQSVTYKVTKAGPIHLKCKIHPGMNGWLYVTPSQYFTTTKSNGSYALDNLPAGKYRVVVWQPDAVQQEQVVTVAGGVNLNFKLKKK